MLRNSKPEADLLRKIKVQTGAVKRIGKDLSYYEQEAEKQQERIKKLVTEGADEHDVRKQEEVLEETNQMLPESRQRLATAQKALRELLDKFSTSADETTDVPEEITNARALLSI
ncbi:tubulin binding cofactor A-domain-containing protein [Gaertneriomyces semiglobifer]|nr:tubulin binding cofactor A-domain-containing protein [Gaertneriomyces semiglobifer]